MIYTPSYYGDIKQTDDVRTSRECNRTCALTHVVGLMEVTRCFTPSQLLRLYEGEGLMEMPPEYDTGHDGLYFLSSVLQSRSDTRAFILKRSILHNCAHFHLMR